MGLPKPTGPYAEQMLAGSEWPQVDEQSLYDRAEEYTQVLRDLTDVLQAAKYQRSEIFDAAVWSGSAASAANGQLGTLVDELGKLQDGLTTVITWQKYVALVVVQTKY